MIIIFYQIVRRKSTPSYFTARDKLRNLVVCNCLTKRDCRVASLLAMTALGTYETINFDFFILHSAFISAGAATPPPLIPCPVREKKGAREGAFFVFKDLA